MPIFNSDNINKMPHIYRINLINSCSGYKSANLIGTMAKNGISNVAVFSSVIHLGSNPALLGFILRPTTVARNTYDNLKETGYFTINHIYEGIIKEAHHTSAKYDKSISEFDVTALEEEYHDSFLAPFVKGSPVQIAMSYAEEHPIKINGTTMVVGKIEAIYINDDLLEDDGFVNLSKGNIATINSLDGYAIPELKTRFGYQRPKPEFVNKV